MADASHRLQSALAERYRIERELGRGGMATVYLAEDLKHHRSVAIKVLDPELAAAIGPERFLREIETAARLNHPQILPLHDSGAAEGLLYYVMPFVEGESLRARLRREKQLPLEDALRITREVAEALEYAHSQGVVHRDIKPENILMSRGHAVVADFGIARAIRAAGGPKLTETGLTLGTPLYMSPEQAIGGGELDGRSDQYSLGCVLYEMMAGQPPFTGPTGESLVHQHLSVEPRSVAELRPAVPAGVARALRRSLAKTPADRFGTLTAFADALGGQETPAIADATTVAMVRPERLPWRLAGNRRALVAVGVLAIAAAAFIGWEKRDDLRALFGGRGTAQVLKKDWILVAEFDGPADDPTLAVAVRLLVSAALDQSVIVAAVPDDQIRLALEQAGKPPGTRVDAALARELAYRRSIRAVVEGHVSRLGAGYSVVVRVLDADSARALAAVSEAARSDDELIPTVGRVVRRLRDALGERQEALRATRELSAVMTPSFEAYRRLVKARELLFGNDNRGAIAMARSALSFDPDFAPAWGVIGFSFGNLGEPDSSLVAFDEALRRPGRLTEVARVMGQAAVAALRGDPQAALEAIDQALLLDPSRQGGHNNRGAYLLSLGRLEEALAACKRAAEVSAFGPNSQTLNNQFVALMRLGRLVEAREVARRMKRGPAEVAIGQIAVAKGDWAAAESLGRALERNLEARAEHRADGSLQLAVAQAAFGSTSAAATSLLRGQRALAEGRLLRDAEEMKRARLLLDMVSGRLHGVPEDVASSDTTTLASVTQGLWEAAAGDTARARRLLARIRTRSVLEHNRHGSNPAVIEAWIAARAGRFAETVRILGPAARQGDDLGFVQLGSNGVLKRWLVAESYEYMGKADSAAAYFELAISPIGGAAALGHGRIAHSYAHRRLVLLYSRMGHLEEARRHWEVFSTSFTRPDPEMLPRIEEARAALASAEAMAGAARR